MGKVDHDGDEWLTTQQVVELTGWPRSSVNRWALKGTLPARKLTDLRTAPYLIRRADVEARKGAGDAA